MNSLMIFENKQVEVFELNGQVLFNPKHVADCLDIKNVNDNISRMNEKQVIKLTNSKIGKADFRKLHNTGENFLTESGVYKLMFKSHKEEAERFQDWVTDEVLPLIRKTGSYYIKKEKTEREKALEIIAGLPNDRYKNRAVVKILNFVDNSGGERRIESKPILTDEEVKSILWDFIAIGDGILRETINGLALEKEKLYKCFAKYGLSKTDVLRAIDKIGLIPESFASRTPNVKYKGDVIRAIVIKEI